MDDPQYCVGGERVFLDSTTAGDLTSIKDEDPCTAELLAFGPEPVEAVAPAAGGLDISMLLPAGLGVSIVGLLGLKLGARQRN